MKLLEFCPELVAIINDQKCVGRTGSVHNTRSLSSTNNLVTLRNLLMEHQPTRTLEIGFALGSSALLFTAIHRDLGHAPARQHSALDPFQSEMWDEAGLMVVEKAGLSGYLDFRADFSRSALPQMMTAGERLDFVYIDGSHIFEDVFVDWYYVSRLLKPGGIVALDDSSLPDVAKVLKFINRNCAALFKPIDLSPYRPDKGATLNYKAAKLLGKTQLTAFRRLEKFEREWDSPFTDF